jgi:hypothetical protein
MLGKMQRSEYTNGRNQEKTDDKGQPVTTPTPKLDDQGKPVMGSDGKPVMTDQPVMADQKVGTQPLPSWQCLGWGR